MAVVPRKRSHSSVRESPQKKARRSSGHEQYHKKLSRAMRQAARPKPASQRRQNGFTQTAKPTDKQSNSKHKTQARNTAKRRRRVSSKQTATTTSKQSRARLSVTSDQVVSLLKDYSYDATALKTLRLQKGLDPGEKVCLRATVDQMQGYIFVPIGDVYVSRHCRSRTLESGQTLYIVHTWPTLKRIGLGCPISIVSAVRTTAASTAASRAAAVLASDERKLAKARATLLSLFPNIPPANAEAVLQHSLEKYSGRVGRSTKLEDEQKIRLAVQAHVRHVVTPYERLMRGKDGVKKDVARRVVRGDVERVLREWMADSGSGG